MSLVYLTYHNENVQDLDDVDGEEKPPKFKYTSKFRETIKKEAQKPRLTATADGRKLLAASGKYEHRTMGYVKTPLNAPTEFMKKNHGVKWLRINDHVCPKDSNLPSVPRRPSTVVIDPKCEKNSRANFIALNIDRVKQLQSKRPNPRYIDTPHGDRQNLLNTGLIPQYVNRKNFGKVPSCVRTQRKLTYELREPNYGTEEQRTFKQNGDYINMYGGVRKLTNEERETIIEGLKANFLEQSRTFQRLSLYTDTLAKKLRKSRIENILRQLEQDIYLMEKNPVIYVSNY